MYCSSDCFIEQIKESCSTRGGVEHTGFWWGNVKEGLRVGGKVILKHLTRIGWELVNWINLIEVRDNGVAFVKPGMKLDLYNGVLSRRTVHQTVFFSLMCGQTQEAN